MSGFREFGLVRVIQILHLCETSALNRRSPKVGDMGTIVDISPVFPDVYTVESIDSKGVLIWLDDFSAEELTPIENSEYIEQFCDQSLEF